MGKLVPMTTTLAEIRSAFDGLNDALAVSDYADKCAIGVWTDDPSDPGVTAVVFQGKLYALTIPDAYTTMDPLALTDLVNLVIVNAFIEWNEDRKRLLAAANDRKDAAQ